MPSLSLGTRRDPWWEADGPAARAARRRRRARGLMAFAVSLVAFATVAVVWCDRLGLPRLVAAHLGLSPG